MISRRNFLVGVSAAATVAVSKANAPLEALESLVDEQLTWVPEGFIVPRGQTLSRLMYPDLFAAVGKHYGYGPTTFKLPDFNRTGDFKVIMAATSTDRVPAGMVVDYYAPSGPAIFAA